MIYTVRNAVYIIMTSYHGSLLEHWQQRVKKHMEPEYFHL